ncbi:hypothetical protein VTO42DRAFT_7119 [Malbranchea cinnamomea]
MPHNHTSPHPMRPAGPGQAQPLITDENVGQPQQHIASPQARMPPRHYQQAASHSRDVSTARGRPVDAPGFGLPPLSQFRSQSHSRSPEAAAGRSRGGTDRDVLERRPSNSYGHHRQTSIVHGNIQHSLDPSFTSSSIPTTSPITPEVIASAGLDDSPLNGKRHHNDVSTSYGNSTANSAGQLQPQTFPPAQDVGTKDRTDEQDAQKEPIQGGKSRRGHSRHASHSKNNGGEPRTVGEYALHHLFNSFVGQAEEKINNCIMSLGNPGNPVELICGPGADPSFDQLIQALGHIAKKKPKPLVDTIMMWRKSIGDAAAAAKQMLYQPKMAHPGAPITRRNTEPTQSGHETPETSSSTTALVMPVRHEDVLMAERRATVSVYLVCRVLIEVFNQSTLEAITPEMADRLEDIVFGQLKAVDPDQIAHSVLRMANWRIYGQLLGIMSETNFASVSGRFLNELGLLSVKEAESKAELLVYGMRHLHIGTYPEDIWLRTCDFLCSLARLFVECHGQRLKQAYCQIMEGFLMPIAADSGCDLSTPRWKDFLELMMPRLAQLVVKPRAWSMSFPLYVLLLCTSPKEAFLSQWMSVINSLPQKLKGPTRGLALQAICRLVWTFLFRHCDPMVNPVRKIEEIIRIVLPAGRKTYLTTDPAVAEPITQLVRMIGYKYPDMCFRTIIFPLVSSDLFVSGKELKIEQLEPEKIVIGIKSFLAIMADLDDETKQQPPFPQEFSSGLDTVSCAAPPPQAASCRPVNPSKLDEKIRKSYYRFCEILGKITLLCDNTFGGQAALDEKFGGVAPKTPIAEHFSFGRRSDDQANAPDQKQAFYDLLHVAVQALPRCLSDHIPFNSLINLLCTGTAHVQTNIAISSAESLKSIAQQSHAQQVAIGFARFIFNFDARYSTMSDEGMLGPGHIESTLTLYVELIQIWIEEIRRKCRDASAESADKSGGGSRGLQLDLSSVLAYVEEIESHGLFFLCSQSRRVRSFAITVLRLVTEFDKALGKDNTRIIRILEGDAHQILDLKDDLLTVAERTRLEKGKQGDSSKNTLIELCSSEVSYDSTLWSKVFPNIIRTCFDLCPFAVTLGREIVCTRLVQMHKSISAIAEAIQPGQYSSLNLISHQQFGPSGMSAEIMIEQWKLYLIMACTTLNSVGAQSQSQLANAQHSRKNSKGGQQSQDKINSARSLFAFVIPLLSAGHESIRSAIVVALGSINKSLYRTLLESLQYAVTTCNEEARVRIGAHHRTPSSPRRNRRTDLLRTEVTHVYKATSHFLKDPEVLNEDWILNNLVTYTRDLRIFLNDVEVQNDLEFQSLRFHYCGLLEELFEGINRTKDPSRWMSFESRKSAFSLMEEWCGFSPNQAQINAREEAMRKLALARQRETGEIRSTAAMEIEKRNLRMAALSAMASLCGGPIRITTESKAVLQFDIRRMLSWIDTILNDPSDKLHSIGRRALKNLIVHNKDFPNLLERCIEMCYLSEKTKALESYFEVLTQVLTEHTDYPVTFWRVLGAVLFTLGNANREIRMKSARLLRTLEERQQKNSRLQDFDISISDKTTAVYKLAQFETSKRLAQQHADLAFNIFSEFSMHFKNIQPDSQRNMVAAILPWVQAIELRVDQNGGPTAQSYMLLANLLEITIRSSNTLSNEVQALWQALATGPHGGNVQLVLDFVISLCLERKEQNFIDYAKQIVVFLASTPAGSKVIEFFLLQVLPKNMVQERKDPSPIPDGVKFLPYVADLGTVLPVGNKQPGFSLGQVSMILLVDLMVAPVTIGIESVIKLVHVALIFWDHYILTVQEQARELLVHLIHELVSSKLEGDDAAGKRKAIEDFVESVRQSDPRVVWEYEDNNGKEDAENESRVPSTMQQVTEVVADFFSAVYNDVDEIWSREALSWATSCPVRHLACRSFQIFRCTSTSLDSRMLADMLARLSNTIAEEETDYQTFSMEILTTLKIIISSLTSQDLMRYPQLFWATCACLNTIHEREFVESLNMLEKYLEKIDMTDQNVLAKLKESKPPKWSGEFNGIQPLIYKGLKSSQSLDKTLNTLYKLTRIPNDELIGDGNRLLFAVWANLPVFLHQFGLAEVQVEVADRARLLASVAENQGCAQVADCLFAFASSQYSNGEDLLNDIISSISAYYFPDQDLQSLVFIMGLLTNSSSWFRIHTLKILGAVITVIDMRRPHITCHGPDLISPLLRLLHTDLCPQTLEVLDRIMTVANNPMERHHLRMSMASATSSRAFRKEFEKIQSLYGIPEPTGWSIPVPAAQSAMTRANVHAVFYTCAEADGLDTRDTSPTEMEFHVDDFSEPYFPTLRADTMQLADTQNDTNSGDLLQKLDSLDDFFDDVDANTTPLTSMPGSGLRPLNLSDYQDASAYLYDQQTAPLLRQSLAHNSSSSSFQNGLAEARVPLSRGELGAIHSSPMSTGSSVSSQVIRTLSHARSVTSPNNYLPTLSSSTAQGSTSAENQSQVSQGSLTSSDDDFEDALSDTDDRQVFNHHQQQPYHQLSASTTALPREGQFPGDAPFRPGMRRLMGGSAVGRERDRQREILRGQQRAYAQTATSPRVPKVPAEYLVGSTPGSPGHP